MSEPATAEQQTGTDVEHMLQRFSLVVSLLALVTMLTGLVLALAAGGTAFPGDPAVPLGSLAGVGRSTPWLLLTSLGIVALAGLPALRVAVAGWLYLRQHRVANVLICLLVLVELLISMRSGG